jgi:hypothetical protein
MGFQKDHLLPFLSDPKDILPGSFVILERSIYYNPKGLALEKHRDTYLFGYAPTQLYTLNGLPQILTEFHEAGYDFLITNEIWFSPRQVRMTGTSKSRHATMAEILLWQSDAPR